MKQDDIDKYLRYDKHQRYSLIDHIFAIGTTLGDYINSTYDEIGDFIDKPYSYVVDALEDDLLVHLKRDGSIRFGEKHFSIRVEKDVAVKMSDVGMEVRYLLTNTSDVPIEGLFASEWNLSLEKEPLSKSCCGCIKSRRAASRKPNSPHFVAVTQARCAAEGRREWLSGRRRVCYLGNRRDLSRRPALREGVVVETERRLSVPSSDLINRP